MEQVKMPKKGIHISKELKDIETDITTLLDKNEAAIRAYISRYIFTSSISAETNQQLDAIFKEAKGSIM
jgi:hypothetical protein